MASLKALFEQVKGLGVVETQSEFSELWGKAGSWFSSSVTRDRNPGLDALVRFHVSLIDMEENARQAARDSDNQELAESYQAGADEVSRMNAMIWSEIMNIARGDVAGRP